MEIPVQKNKEYIVDIIDNGLEDEGIAKIDNYTIFVQGAIKGEKCKILVLKTTASHAFAKIVDIIKKTEYRCEPDCSTYKRCGGCSMRHIDYDKTLDIKQEKVQNLINKTLINKVKVKSVLGMGNPYNYRNKAQYPVGIDKNGRVVYGVFAKRTHDIVPVQDCKIQKTISLQIAEFVVNQMKKFGVSAYNENTRTGLVRHIITKVGIQTNEVMVILVINGKDIPHELTIANNVIMGEKNKAIVGRGYITDKLGDFIFKISPMSFYQVNPIQAEALYNIAIEKANITKEDVVCDLYCGIGTIGIFASKYAKKVYGIEIVKQAIEDARVNANLNNIENIDFLCGDVEEAFEELIKKHKVRPDVVIVDPPRRGLDEKTVENIMKLKTGRVVYISCNPATMVRDLKLMEEMYDVVEVQPVDMFPFTGHVECCVVMGIKES